MWTTMCRFKLIIFICIPFLTLISCEERKNDELETALNLAGPNKKELKKVLDYYKKNPDDSLKYKAACFLIENMRWHYGPQIKPSGRFWELFLHEDSISELFKLNPGIEKYENALYNYKKGKKKTLIKQAINESEIDYGIHADLLYLDADFLIENIDAAFKVKGREWNKNLSFEQFCEYILPYRFHDEAVYPIRKNLNTIFDKLYYIDSLKHDSHKTISYLNRYFWRTNWDWTDEQTELPDLGFYNIFYWNIDVRRTCTQQVAALGQLIRSIGLPVLELFIPRWRDMNLGHTGCVIPESDGTLTYFTALYQQPGTVRKPHRPQLATKMYIRTYCSQPNSAWFLRTHGEKLPLSFNTPCLLDVTDKFVETRDIEIPLKKTNFDNNLCWFCVFIQGSWVPVGWGIIDKVHGIVRFESVPYGLTGIASIMDNMGNLIPNSGLFTNDKNGLEFIQPNNEITDLYLLRKFHVKERMIDAGHKIIGTKIQGANESDFSDSVTLFTINDTLEVYYQDLAFKNANGYRYYRLIAPTNTLDIAELEFIINEKKPDSEDASPLPIFTKDEAFQKKYYKVLGDTICDKPGIEMFDGDMLTFSAQKWAGMDFGKPVKINRVRIAPRNADNGIVIGDHYQLFYWDDAWIPAGVQQAKYNFLEYTEIPAKTIYWLRNIDHGKEEQPFFYLHGKQVFSNQPQKP